MMVEEEELWCGRAQMETTGLGLCVVLSGYKADLII